LEAASSAFNRAFSTDLDFLVPGMLEIAFNASSFNVNSRP
jgi:hypothetical protein